MLKVDEYRRQLINKMGTLPSKLSGTNRFVKLIAAIFISYHLKKLYTTLRRQNKKKRLESLQSNHKIIIIGAGISEICMAKKLKHDLGITNFIIYESALEIGTVLPSDTHKVSTSFQL